MASVHSRITKYEITEKLMKETVEFLKKQGLKGLEGLVFWVGRTDQVGIAKVTRIYIPEQVAQRSALGVSVEMTKKGQLEYIGSLKDGEWGLAKLHSHPQKAYLSSTDLANPSFNFEGAISIVVPYFAANIKPSEIGKCAIFRRSEGKWNELSPDTVKKTFKVVR